MKTSVTRIAFLLFALMCSACGGGGGGGGGSAAGNGPTSYACRPAEADKPYLQTANAGGSVSLNDVASCPHSAAISYKWTLLSKPQGSQGVLAATTVRTPAFQVDVAGMYLFRMEETGDSTQRRTLALVAQAPGTSPSIAEHILTGSSLPPKLEFAIKPNLNNQGIAYNNGYFYVGYDITNGKGMIERYSAAGVLDPNFGRTAVPTFHTAELAYRNADDRLYAVTGGGTEPTSVNRLTQDGKAVDKVYDFTAYGTAGLIAIDNDNDLLVLATTITGGDKGDPVIRLIDLKDGVSVLLQFSVPNQGVPQGIEIADGVIYLYTNGRITTLDLAGNVIARKDLDIPGESQGITVVTQGSKKSLAVGYNQTGRIYSIPTN